MMNSSQTHYCAFCKSKKNYFPKKHISFKDFVLNSALSLIIMMSLWFRFDFRVFLILIMTLVLNEVFCQLRWRFSLNCNVCGFDPILYLKNKGEACEKVKIQLEKRKSNPFLEYPILPKIKKQLENIKLDSQKTGPGPIAKEI